MLRWTLRLASERWGPERTRAANIYRNKPLFKQPTTSSHLYSNPENASDNDTVEEHLSTLRNSIKKVFHSTFSRYYFTGTLLLGAAAYILLRQKERDDVEAMGLAGGRLRPYRSRLTVVLDTDETLLSYGDKAYRLKAGLVPRPHLAALLDYLVSIDAEVILWSSCSDRYMQEILSAIDPNRSKISFVITRNSLWFSGDNYYEKNLRWLKRDLNDTLIVENRPLSVRSCNANAILVDDFIRGEYMDTGMDVPHNDRAMLTLKEIIKDLEESGRPVPEYLADRAKRHRDIKEIPCEYAIRQLPDELARGVFYFIGDKYKPGKPSPATGLTGDLAMNRIP